MLPCRWISRSRHGGREPDGRTMEATSTDGRAMEVATAIPGVRAPGGHMPRPSPRAMEVACLGSCAPEAATRAHALVWRLPHPASCATGGPCSRRPCHRRRRPREPCSSGHARRLPPRAFSLSLPGRKLSFVHIEAHTWETKLDKIFFSTLFSLVFL